MKYFFSNKKEILNEGRSRKEMASGNEHFIYPSTDEPDVVYKLGTKSSINKWYDTFKKNPEVFPKVYKRGRTKIKLKTDITISTDDGNKTFRAGTYFPVDYVKMEKLNTDLVQKEWDLLDKATENIMEIDDYIFLDYLIPYMLSNGDKSINTIDDEMEQNYPEVYPIFQKYINLVDKLLELRPDKKNILDIHRHNFGYDKNGVLKCLDF